MYPQKLNRHPPGRIHSSYDCYAHSMSVRWEFYTNEISNPYNRGKSAFLTAKAWMTLREYSEPTGNWVAVKMHPVMFSLAAFFGGSNGCPRNIGIEKQAVSLD